MNLPNKITVCRILLIPIIIFFYLSQSFFAYGKLVASILFLIGVLTDYFDGHIARKTGQVTVLGTFLDTIADKMFVTTALLLVISDNTIASPFGVIFAVIIVLREFMVSALRQLGASKNVIISADMFGKIKAVLQFIALFIFMLYSALCSQNVISGQGVTICYYICFSVLCFATFITLLSGINYIIKNKGLFAKEDLNDNTKNKEEN